MTYNEMWHRLATLYDDNEAKAVCRLLLEELFGFSLTDIVCGATEKLSETEYAKLEEAMMRLEKAEPIQYILGRARFSGRVFHVASGVLIPRPETEQLCRLTTEAARHAGNPAILDIGTGCGCIAITIALDLPKADVSAWDISEEALAIATENAERLGANVCFCHQDALAPPVGDSLWDAIVSNPPYICDREKAEMERNVLENEPHLALFVPDSDPLLFYRSIAKYAVHALKPGGALLFETNQLYAQEATDMLHDMEFSDIKVIKDIFGKDRNIVCKKG